MDFPIYVDIINMVLPSLYLKVKLSKLRSISVYEVVFILTNRADPDKMQHYLLYFIRVFTICQSSSYKYAMCKCSSWCNF